MTSTDRTCTDRTCISGTHAEAAADLDHFAAFVRRHAEGRVPADVFLEQRLRHGVYGQRQDDAYMMRSKLPLGLIGADQLEAFAEVAERFGNGNAHLTTRQDIQTHFVKLEASPDLLRLLNDHDVTAREACGNVVRNVTANPLAGVSATEPFDVTPYGAALARFLLRHPDAQGLGRKLKISLSGDDDPRFNLGAFHDVGLTARMHEGQRGFGVVVGGGLGPVPHEARRYADFVPVDQLLPLCQAILRVFSAHGEKRNRARARLKFLVADWGIERFRAEVETVRGTLPPAPDWAEPRSNAWLSRFRDEPLNAPATDTPPVGDGPEERRWLRTCVTLQRQSGYAAVHIRVPRGDLSPQQLRGLASLMRAHTGDTLRVGLDQSLVLRWLPFDRLLAVRAALVELDLGQDRASGLGDTVTCPGTDTCKLGLTSPRALSRSIQSALDRLAKDPRLETLRLHVSGCPNACAQHQIADLGFFGSARTVEGVPCPHYMLVLGGRLGGANPGGDAGAPGAGFGNMVTRIPAQRVGDAIERLAALYLEEASPGEPFGAVWRRVGFPRVKALMADLQALPSPSAAPWLYREPGAEAPYVVKRGQGECAGAPVSRADFLLADADQASEAATELLEAGASAAKTARQAQSAFRQAAAALLSNDGVELDDAGAIAQMFRACYYDAGRIPEGVGYYFLAASDEDPDAVTGDRLRRLVVEAGLFVAEAQAQYARRRGAGRPPPAALP